MNILAIVGSPRKGKATDMLVDKAIEGVTAKHPDEPEILISNIKILNNFK
ncbi:MAG: hypothetical protein ABFS43_09970 [Thermodesulfobacteriota bacterium]